MTEKKAVKKLSKGVLDLKFMKRSREKYEFEEEDEQRQILYKDQLEALNNSAKNIVMVQSHYDLMKYLPCRLSFGGNEPEIEKLNATRLTGIYAPLKEELKEEDDEADVTKEEMAAHYSSLNENLPNKFSKKRPVMNNFNKANKKRKSDHFEKPPE